MRFRGCAFAFIIIFLESSFLFAQKEAQNWLFGNGLMLSLESDSFRIKIEGEINVNEGSAVLSDAKGNLQLYSDGVSVWDNSHQVIENGLSLNGSDPPKQLSTPRQGAVFLRNSEDIITLISQGKQADGSNILEYHRITGRAPYKILSRNNLIHSNDFGATEANSSEGMATVEIKDCASREYWLIAGKNDDPGSVFVYKVTEDTVLFNTKIFYGGDQPIRYMKFSPNVNKLVIIEGIFDEDAQRSVWLMDFDPQLGLISSSQEVLHDVGEVFLSSAEFSTNNRYLYLGLDKIYQYDIQLNTFNDVIPGKPDDMQLFNENELLLIFGSSLGIIKDINVESIGSIQIVSLTNEISSRLRRGFPIFPASFFNYNLIADGGEDKQLCEGEIMHLGNESRGDHFKWTPETHLDNPFLANPLFKYQGDINEPEIITYVIESRIGSLNQCDTVKVTVYPEIDRSILGPNSVCPGEENIYSFNPVEGYSYNWQVANGNDRQISEKEIAVQWSSEPGFGQIDLIASSINDICNDDTVSLSVQINVEIDTPIPVGPDSLCVDLENPVNFSTWYRPDATYIWNVENGNITSGQGESSVMVNWLDEGPYSIGLEEVIVTQDTICFGASPILEVNLIEDNSFIDLNLVTVDTSTDESILLSWESFNDLPNDNLIGIWRSVLGIDDFELLAEVSPTQNAYRDMDVSPENNAYSYHLSQNSWCNNLVTSLTHNSIHLQRSEINNQEIELLYNPYTAWLDEGYDVLILTKNISGEPYRVWDQAPSNSSPLVVEGLPVANEYYFRVGAKRDNALVSWSNEIGTDFNPPLNIPNVFTPNNDGTNDIFDFPNLEYYPENILKIFDRSGNEINTINNYEGKWDGAQLASGLYYYHFKELRNGLSYNGWFKILR